MWNKAPEQASPQNRLGQNLFSLLTIRLQGISLCTVRRAGSTLAARQILAEPHPLPDADRAVKQGLCVDVSQRQPGMDFFFSHPAKVSANCFCWFSLGKELQLRAEGLSAAQGGLSVIWTAWENPQSYPRERRRRRRRWLGAGRGLPLQEVSEGRLHKHLSAGPGQG